MAVEDYATLVETLQQNADWRVGPSAAKARAFVTAATKLLVMMPVSSSDDGHSTSTNITQIESQMKDAQAYLNSIGGNTSSTSKVRFLTTRTGFRR